MLQRYLRQQDILPRERIENIQATVIGVGAVGRQVALQLAAIGVSQLQLIDHDVVEDVNLAPQGFMEDDLGRTKVNATGDLCHQINHGLAVHEIPERFRRSMEIGDSVFICVDSIETRRHIWHSVSDRAGFIVDGRMNAEVIRVVTAMDGVTRQYYPSTLFRSEEAEQGRCTAKSTIFTANLTAGFMLEQFARWLRQLPVDRDLQLNLLASDLVLL